MTLAESINYVRSQVAEGKNLQVKADPDARETGRKRLWQARRIARRLGYKLAELSIDI
jgi:hypothetical protein